MWFWVSLVLLTVPIAFRQVTVSDAWWHAAIGKWLVRERSLPDLSRFYFTPYDAGWLPGELRWTWLGDVLLYVFFAIGGSVGLQILSLLLLFGGLYFLLLVPPRPRSPWALALISFAVVGTYQLQLIRNSAFSLLLYPVVLWLGLRKDGAPTLKDYLILSGVLGLWSCLHGSCTLGWATACVLFLDRSLRGIKGLPISRILKRLAGWGAAILAALVLISVGRPDALHFLSLPVRHAVALSTPQAAPPVPALQESATREPSPEKNSPMVAVKTWLNNSVWKKDPSSPWSNDFWSPFDFPLTPLIVVPLVLIVASAIAVLAFRNIRWGLLVAWLGACFLALGYVRMLGYASLASAAVLLCSLGQLVIPAPTKKFLMLSGWLVVAMAACYFWGILLSGQMDDVLGEGQHVPSFGHTPNFDPHTLEWLKKELPNSNVFSTIDSGSVALLVWNFEKPVFIDGFFAPHTSEVLRDYALARTTDNVALLHEKYGVTAAVIPNTSEDWREVFLFAPDWRPVALGLGSTVFLHKSVPATPAMPAVLYEISTLKKSSDLFMHHSTVATLSVLGHSVRLQGGFPVTAWVGRNPQFFEESRRLAEELAKRNTQRAQK